MALTRPNYNNLQTNVEVFTTPMTVLHGGSNQANVDVGFLFNRANGLVSNVSLYWSESSQSIVHAFTSNTGLTNSNIAITSYTPVDTGNLTVHGNVTVTANEYVNTVNAINVYASTIGNTGATLTGTLSTAAQPNITSVGTLAGLHVNSSGIQSDGTIITGTVNAAIIGNVGATHTGSTLTLSSWANIAGPLVVTNNTAVQAIQVAGTSTKGGAGYHDFLLATNLGGGTNPNKSFRLDSSGNFQIINSAYTATIFQLSDAGVLGGFNQISVSGSTGTSGQVLSSTGSGLQWVASGGFSGGAVPNQTTFASNVIANSGTTSTNNTTGALVVVGGMGVSGNVWAGQVYATNNGNGTNFAVGDDAWIGDINIANTMGVKGQQDATQGYIVFGNANNTNYIGRNGSNPITVTGSFNVTNDLTVSGNINASYLNTVSSSQLSVTAPLLYLTGQAYPYNYDIGTYSHFIGGPANVYAHTGIVRSYQNNYWGFFSNVKSEPAGTINWGDAGLIWDTIKAGALTLANASGTVLTVSGNTAINSTIYAQGIYDNSNRVLSTSSGAGNLSISGTAVTLPATGPGATTVGSSTSIPVITTDAYGRISALTSSAVSTTINLSAGSGSGSVAGGGTLTVSGSTGLTTSVSSSTITLTNSGVTSAIAGTGVNVSSSTGAVTISIGQAVATTSSPTFAGLTSAGSVIPSANVTYNLGSSTAWWSTVYGKAVQAQYADLAENYLADADYPPGTVVVFGGDKEITVTTLDHDTAVAGVISTDPAYLMNAVAKGLPVALTGRVPCRVQGPVIKGQVLVTSSTPGVAQAIDNSKFLPGCVVGKALETINTNTIETIEVVVGRF